MARVYPETVHVTADMMGRTCKTCAHWTEYHGRPFPGWHYCAMTDDDDPRHINSLALVDGWEGGVLRTAPDFGCSQWQAKDGDDGRD